MQINDTDAIAERQQPFFFKKLFAISGYLIALIVSDLPRAPQNVRFRSFLYRRTVLYQRLKDGIFAPESS
jgi:hypothetical protein